MENRSLWYKVLLARYGEVGGSIAEGGRFNSVWWNNLINIRRGSGVGIGRCYEARIRIRIRYDTIRVRGYANFSKFRYDTAKIR